MIRGPANLTDCLKRMAEHQQMGRAHRTEQHIADVGSDQATAVK